MTNQKTWIKSHKNEFAKNLIAQSGATPDGNPMAIFMAGLPGAGKTEFSKSLVDVLSSKAVRLDMDEIAVQIEGYTPEKANLFRAGASELLNRAFDIILRKGLDFIMDGTFSSTSARSNVKRALSRSYGVKIIYVYQDPKLAWSFTKEREKVEHRAIDEKGFIDAYFNTIKNIKNIIDEFSDEKITLDIIVKDRYNESIEWESEIGFEEIDKTLDNHYSKETLKDYIDD
ncbi:zeta toxin family protein [Candidatus Saccharibacteria bacterium]|nr:zeta toxin family protein [Candidatus Saccharibacteria bacterium]